MSYYVLRKETKTKRISKKFSCDQKFKIKILTFVLFIVYKIEQEALYFGENDIIKNAFHKNKRPRNINEVDIKRIVLSDKKSYGNKDTFKYLIGYRHKGNSFPAP